MVVVEPARMEALLQLIRTGISFMGRCPDWVIVLICMMIFSLVVTLPLTLPRLWPKHRASRNEPRTVSAGNEQKDPIETARDDLRLYHQVRPLSALEETCLKDMIANLTGAPKSGASH